MRKMSSKTVVSRLFSVAIILFLCFALLPYVTAEQIPQEGSPENPIEVANWDELNEIRYNLDLHYVLVSDLDSGSQGYGEHVASGYGWLPLGNSSSRFTGSLDGNYHRIKDIYINRAGSSVIGLFGFVSPGAEIRNLGLEDMNITGNWYVGGLVGVNHGRIVNTYTHGSVFGYGFDVGGLIGVNYGDVSVSCSHADVTGLGARVGGLLGNHNYADLTDTYASGSVKGSFQVGGLVGWVHWAQVYNSYSYATVTGGGNTGGLIGQNWRGRITNSFWDTETSGMIVSSGGRGKETIEMKEVSTYTSLDTTGLVTAWDFVGDPYDDRGTENIWDIDGVTNDGYPYFPWPESVGYELKVNMVGQGTILVDDEAVDTPYSQEYAEGTVVQLECIPDEGWVFIRWDGYHSTESEVSVVMNDNLELTAVLALNTEVSIEPKTLNLRSKGNWVTVYIGIQEEACIESISLAYGDDKIYAEWGDRQSDDVLMVKFSMSGLQEMIESGYVELMIEGELTDGTYFVGFDTIRAIRPGR